MKRALLTVVLAVAALTASTASAASDVELTPVGRLPFPERGFVVDLPPLCRIGVGADAGR